MISRRVAKFNRRLTNRFMMSLAGWMPFMGILIHQGRKSQMKYKIPINVFRSPDGFILALTYCRNTDWVKNVQAANGCQLERGHKIYRLSGPEIVRDPSCRLVPIPFRWVLRLVRIDEFMRFKSQERL